MTALICALDVPDYHSARELAKRVSFYVGAFKVGLELFMAAGPSAVRGFDVPVMLDLKLHDIPETVERAVKQAVGLGVKFITIHAQQRETLERVAKATEGTDTTALVVTVLTSIGDRDLFELDYEYGVETTAFRRALLAQRAGLRGLVCSPDEIAMMRREFPDAIIVSPGIRHIGAVQDDQQRVGTPRQAAADGADYIVVGRPIRDAADPTAAARAIVEELAPV